MTPADYWRYALGGVGMEETPAERRAAWFAAFARLELPAGAGLLTHDQLVATLTARQAACDAAWAAWQGETGDLAPLEEAS